MVDAELVSKLNYTSTAAHRFVIVRFHFCDQMNMEVEGLTGRRLHRYDKKWIRIGDDEDINNNSLPPYHYYATFDSFSHDKKPIGNDPSILDYDLRKEPRDICLYINIVMPFAPITNIISNVVRIPKEMLIKFFAEHPRRAPPSN